MKRYTVLWKFVAYKVDPDLFGTNLIKEARILVELPVKFWFDILEIWRRDSTNAKMGVCASLISRTRSY